jgi:pyruvate formate-lyase/glycerol dehydratase family glycyl radical enzyme
MMCEAKLDTERLKEGFGPSTPRTQQLRQAFMEQKPNICAERSVLVTESYKQTEGMPPVLRQAIAFDNVLSEMSILIQDNELIVGNMASRPKGAFLFPEYGDSWLAPELDTISTRTGDPWMLSDEDKESLKACSSYWPGKTLNDIIDAHTPDKVKETEKIIGSDITFSKTGGIGHIVPDIERVLSQGLNTLIEQAEAHLSDLDLSNPHDYQKLHFLQAVIIADKAVIKWANRFADLAREKAATEQDQKRKSELNRIADICDWVPANPARDLWEAMQVVVFIMDSVQIETNGVSIGVGRFDQYCFPYYEKDIREGSVTKAQATELLECLWLKLAEAKRVFPEYQTARHYGYPFWVQVPVGGQTADGYDATNVLSYVMLEISSNMQLSNPTVSARIHNRTPETFLMKCCEAIKNHGGGHPALFNDEVIIPSQLAYVPGITKEDAYDYNIIGCSEIAFGGKGTEGIAGSTVNGGKLLEMIMTGQDANSGSPMASGNGGMTQWESFDDVIQAFSEYTRFYTKALFMQVLPVIDGHKMHRPCPYLSSLTRDCIKRGQAYYGGGAVYGNEVVNATYVGIANIANSFAAIKKLVFDDQVITKAQLKHAVETNFEDVTTHPTGPEIQQMCLSAPKFGNDDAYVDDLAKDCLNIMVKELRKYKTGTGAGFIANIAPVATHMVYGMYCGATPDGRKAGTPLSDACSPAQGTDVTGPTASVKSVANLEHINLSQGTIFNMKLHPAALENNAGMAKWANLVRTYFDLGGWEIQFNVVKAETLKKAQQHPEDYKDLVVRVVGYSAFFVELDEAVQNDIISRTEHAV